MASQAGSRHREREVACQVKAAEKREKQQQRREAKRKDSVNGVERS